MNPWILGGGALALLVLTRSRTASADPRPSTGTGRNESGSPLDPEAYARGKLGTLRARWESGALVDSVARWGPVLWPGTPATAIVGASASSDGVRGGEHSAYPVVGWLSVERSTLARVARDPAAVEAFGRPIPTATVGQRSAWYSDVEAQTFVGLWSLRARLREVNARLPAGARADSGSAYALRLGVGAYSVGAGVVVPLVAGARVEGVPVAERWLRVARHVVAGCRRGGRLDGVECSGHWHAAHFVLRLEQRIACGRLLAQSVGDRSSSWYDAPLPVEVVRGLEALV